MAASDTKGVGVLATINQMVMAPVQVGLVFLPVESILEQGLEVVEIIVET